MIFFSYSCGMTWNMHDTLCPINYILVWAFIRYQARVTCFTLFDVFKLRENIKVDADNNEYFG